MSTYIREVSERKISISVYLFIYFSKDLTRNEKIQQARRIVNENPGAIDAWAILIQDAQVNIRSIRIDPFNRSFFSRRKKSLNHEISMNYSLANFQHVENSGSSTLNLK